MKTERTKPRNIEIRCCMCSTVYKASRKDKDTCSPKCRKHKSRVLAALADGKKPLDKVHESKPTKCFACGFRRDGRVVKCPICGEQKTKKVKS